LRFSRKGHDGSAPIFFQRLGENAYSLQPALKTTAPSLQGLPVRQQHRAVRKTTARNKHCKKLLKLESFQFSVIFLFQ